MPICNRFHVKSVVSRKNRAF